MVEGPQLRQSAQQAAEPLWAPSRSSARGPARPGQQVQDRFLQLLHTVCRLQGRSVCGAETEIRLSEKSQTRGLDPNLKVLIGCET